MKSILLIEDDADMRDNTAEILSLAGYHVTTAEDGKRGIAAARQLVPDLVLCDIMMPELDGYGVLFKLGHDPVTAEVPFIFLSAKADRADIRKGMQLGADDYLSKPFTERELLDAVEGRLKRSELFRKGFDHGADGLGKFLDRARGTEALQHIGTVNKTRAFGKKETLFHEGDDMHHVPYLVSGKVRTFMVNNDGKEFVTGLHGAGDFIGYMGMLESGRATESAETMEASSVALIPRNDLLALLYKDRDVSVQLIKMLARNVKEKEQHLLQLAYASVRQRVAQALLRIHDRFNKEQGDDLGVRISRDDLAAIVGTATESLIRCLSDLKDEGLIATNGRDIRILDQPKLTKLARQ